MDSFKTVVIWLIRFVEIWCNPLGTMSQLHDQDQGSRNIFPGIPRVLLDDKFSPKTSESDEFENAMSTFHELELIDDHEKEPSYFSRLQVTQGELLTSGNIDVQDMRRILSTYVK